MAFRPWVLAFVIFPLQLWAYPNSIGLSYQSCLTCHYNPFGNGPLNDYGRAIGAGVISDRIIWSETKSEDEISQNSGFLYSKPKQQWFRPSASYRGLYLINQFNEDQEESVFINMQADLNVVVKSADNRWYASVSAGYAPTPRGDPSNTEPNVRSREHYLGTRINDHWGIYIGLMDKIFGIRLSDHTAYSRAIPKVAQNDQSHGVLFHYTSPKMDLGLQGFLGNLSQDPEVRQQGVAWQMEYTVDPMFRPGLSFMTSKSELVKDLAWSGHLRKGFKKGHALLVEGGQVVRTSLSSHQSVTSRYGYARFDVMLKRGLFLFNKVEYLKSNAELEDYVVRFGPGAQYFPFQGLELRIDAYNSRVFSASTSSKDQWNLTGQVHLWL